LGIICIAMLSNYLKIAFRSILKHRIIALINILGLSVAVASALLIYQYVENERSYDKFHPHKEWLFRLQEDLLINGAMGEQMVGVARAAGPEVAANFAEVEAYTQVIPTSIGEFFVTLSYDNVAFRETNTFFVSKDFFKVFKAYKLLYGVDSLVLSRPNTIVISQSVARRYFQDEDPVGKIMAIDHNIEYEVTGVFSDIQENTHMTADVLLSLETIVARAAGFKLFNWQDVGYHTYFLLRPGTDVAALETKISDFAFKQDEAKFTAQNERPVFHLQKIDDIHLDSHFRYEYKENGDRATTEFLVAIALFILIIGWINYLNLYTSKSMSRVKEVGIRKVIGGRRFQLFLQFLLESAVLNALAMIVALGMLWLYLTRYNYLLNLPLHTGFLSTPKFWIVFFSVFLSGTLLGGLFPALLLSAYQAVDAIKGRFSHSPGGIWLRKGLVVFQFAASLVLVIATLCINFQLNYMKTSDLGANIEGTLVVRSPNFPSSAYDSLLPRFKHEFTRKTGVFRVTASTIIPGFQPAQSTGSLRRLGQGPDDWKGSYVSVIDEDFLETFGLRLIAGRNFNSTIPNEGHNILMTETCARQLGFGSFQDVIGQQVVYWRDTATIVGIVGDYHQESLKTDIKPMLFEYGVSYHGFYSFKVTQQTAHTTIDYAREVWSALYPSYPFEYYFLEDSFNAQYNSEKQFGTLVGIFSTVAIIIACMGLFGLSALSAIQRLKEIGVRKVLGARSSEIILLLSKDFLWLVLSGIVVALPISWYLMDQWLEEYAFRMALRVWMFLVPAVLLILIAFITVAIRAGQASLINPVYTLKED